MADYGSSNHECQEFAEQTRNINLSHVFARSRVFAGRNVGVTRVGERTCLATFVQ
jgi:hypothetical protein